MFCSLCGQHARHAKSPVPDLRRKPCPRFPGGSARSDGEGHVAPQLGVVHRGCCAQEACSGTDGRGHVRCLWDQGGRERVAAAAATARAQPAAAPGRA